MGVRQWVHLLMNVGRVGLTTHLITYRLKSALIRTMPWLQVSSRMLNSNMNCKRANLPLNTDGKAAATAAALPSNRRQTGQTHAQRGSLAHTEAATLREAADKQAPHRAARLLHASPSHPTDPISTAAVACHNRDQKLLGLESAQIGSEAAVASARRAGQSLG